jgi:2-keto-4-pentenoate hydratase
MNWLAPARMPARSKPANGARKSPALRRPTGFSRNSRRAGNAVRGWKVTALSIEQQRGYLTGRPVAGALLSPFVHTAPSVFSAAQFVVPLLECEVAFLLGADLPPREQDYTRREIEAAVEAVVPAMEIADSRWPANAPDLLKLADSMGNGAFIAGTPVRDWRKLDLDNLAVSLTHDGASPSAVAVRVFSAIRCWQ